jgi:hypothetical protein
MTGTIQRKQRIFIGFISVDPQDSEPLHKVVNLYPPENDDFRLRDAYRSMGVLLGLRDGWDGYSASKIQTNSCIYLMHVLSNIFELLPQLPKAAIVPLSYGGVQAEWHTWKGDFELEIERDQRFRWYYCQKGKDESFEGAGTTDYREFMNYLTKL